jgi:RNA polymerase sigma-70 factor (ECF subfamily)
MNPSLTPREPFAAVVDRELTVLYRVALQLTRRETDAEDLVAQTLYLGARAWPTFDGAFPRSWLIRILRNEFFSQQRRRANTEHVALDDVAEPSDEGYWCDIDWTLVGEHIQHAIQQLPEEFRMTLVLCDVEGFTRDEAAAALNLKVGTINSRLHRARNLLRAKLVRYVGDPSPEPS